MMLSIRDEETGERVDIRHVLAMRVLLRPFQDLLARSWRRVTEHDCRRVRYWRCSSRLTGVGDEDGPQSTSEFLVAVNVDRLSHPIVRLRAELLPVANDRRERDDG
jgi:hypothetical protein